ncbi:MAG TPA: SIR2 family protein [Desulfovibrio sp.]|uniref:SIR2 family protein n=1 Tax=Desulfovibrio sp. TaxID=885 RepID=UPI002BF63235|nr:SIR2 family protein [Desulfovibrio sp.]HMM39985.1 SIR2 family protein [Desulfovibrio sp.]
MDDLAVGLDDIFRKGNSSPFLFLGSGFSRRYINLEQWAELLKLFCSGLKDYDYYSASCSGDLPSIASMISADFHERWWSDEVYKTSRKTNQKLCVSKDSALKIEISNYLKDKGSQALLDPAHPAEIAALKRINVDGIITTNWDNFIDHIFSDYKVFIGQDELLFAKPQGIGEIYKIHGCTSNPNSLILTKQDYEWFESKNAYLASKLITLFVEHIIVFIGYSLSDKHIINILSSIVNCLGDKHRESLQNNLVFIQRSNGNKKSIERSFFANRTLINTNHHCKN